MRYVALTIFSLVVTGSAVHAQERWLRNPSVLSCAPSVLKSGQTLKLTLGPGHGQELAIQGPRKEQIFLLVVGSAPTEDPQLMTTREFAAAKEVTISVDQVARPWVKDGKLQRVFSIPGTYTVSVSMNLESEVGGYRCKVRYTG